ncbi:hypothetical protein BD410DRAFT_899730 [Rickenella mellea]|uniref:WD40 repeat-like protein n=1 Tax=Rickenella mellea TaxID=50990 RepID=A0A4Y7PZU6_9AGAM|nr:hypothetical protein BD410DRAFT_899730 [Rickenella mellea]
MPEAASGDRYSGLSTLSSTLGVKGSLRVRAYGNVKHAHLVLRKVDEEEYVDENGQKRTKAVFSIFAQKLINVKAGKELYLYLQPANGELHDVPVAIEGDLLGDEDEVVAPEPTVVQEEKKPDPPASSEQAMPPKMRKLWARKSEASLTAKPSSPMLTTPPLPPSPLKVSMEIQTQPSASSVHVQATPPNGVSAAIQTIRPRHSECSVQTMDPPAKPSRVEMGVQTDHSLLQSLLQEEKSAVTEPDILPMSIDEDSPVLTHPDIVKQLKGKVNAVYSRSLSPMELESPLTTPPQSPQVLPTTTDDTPELTLTSLSPSDTSRGQSGASDDVTRSSSSTPATSVNPISHPSRNTPPPRKAPYASSSKKDPVFVPAVHTQQSGAVVAPPTIVKVQPVSPTIPHAIPSSALHTPSSLTPKAEPPIALTERPIRPGPAKTDRLASSPVVISTIFPPITVPQPAPLIHGATNRGSILTVSPPSAPPPPTASPPQIPHMSPSAQKKTLPPRTSSIPGGTPQQKEVKSPFVSGGFIQNALGKYSSLTQSLVGSKKEKDEKTVPTSPVAKTVDAKTAGVESKNDEAKTEITASLQKNDEKAVNVQPKQPIASNLATLSRSASLLMSSRANDRLSQISSIFPPMTVPNGPRALVDIPRASTASAAFPTPTRPSMPKAPPTMPQPVSTTISKPPTAPRAFTSNSAGPSNLNSRTAATPIVQPSPTAPLAQRTTPAPFTSPLPTPRSVPTGPAARLSSVQIPWLNHTLGEITGLAHLAGLPPSTETPSAAAPAAPIPPSSDPPPLPNGSWVEQNGMHKPNGTIAENKGIARSGVVPTPRSLNGASVVSQSTLMARPMALKISLPPVTPVASTSRSIAISSAFDSSARSSPIPNSTPDRPIKEEPQSPTLGLFAELDASRQSAPLSEKSQNGTSYQHVTTAQARDPIYVEDRESSSPTSGTNAWLTQHGLPRKPSFSNGWNDSRGINGRQRSVGSSAADDRDSPYESSSRRSDRWDERSDRSRKRRLVADTYRPDDDDYDRYRRDDDGYDRYRRSNDDYDRYTPRDRDDGHRPLADTYIPRYSPDSSSDDGASWPSWTKLHVSQIRFDGGPGIRSISFNSTGTQFAVICYDHTIRIWNTQTRAEIAKLSHNASVVSLAWIKGDIGIASLGLNGVVNKWTRVGQNQWHWTKVLDAGDTDPVCMAFANDKIAIAYPRTGIKIWFLINAIWQPQRPIVRQNILSIKFVDNGESLVGGTGDGCVWRCRVRDGSSYSTASFKTKVFDVKVSSVGNHVLASQAGGKTHLVLFEKDAQRGDILQEFSTREIENGGDRANYAFGAHFTSHEDLVIFGAVGRRVFIWDRHDGKVKYELDHSSDVIIQAVASYDSSDSSHVVTGNRQGRLTWWSPPLNASDDGRDVPSKRRRND